eukprot:TRINITY_DN18872_c0_g2_i2.p1 TRINITY_DN18872_c0_g2~~TRINITY_DN18872_c0_g2_i2.p1  ORF type:complete len:124 (+),score=52.92 TRINITY_DN18872_c0_g2_i2:44-415(+)
MIRRPPRSTQSRSSAASDVYKRQEQRRTVTTIMLQYLLDALMALRDIRWKQVHTVAPAVLRLLEVDDQQDSENEPEQPDSHQCSVIKPVGRILADNAAPCLTCLLYTSPSPRDRTRSRMPSSA